jgi:hypothetical protein
VDEGPPRQAAEEIDPGHDQGVRMMRLRAVPAALAVACALAPTAAQAGPRFSVGPGKVPHVVVEPGGGTAHVVWLDGETTMECNVPRGAASCSPQVVNMGLPADKANADNPWILRAADGTLYIFMARYVWNDAYLSRSTDGGATWSTGVPIYRAATSGIAGTDITEPVLFPNGEVTIASFNGGGNVFAARLDGAEAGGGPVAQLQDYGGFKYDIQAVPTADGGMIAVSHDGPGYLYVMAPGADPSLSGSWSAPTQFVAATDETRVASGPSGAYALTVEPGGSFRHVLVRKLAAGGFGPPVEAESDQGYLTDLTEGPSGTVAGAWRTNGSDPSNRLRFSTSKDGSAFTTVTIARGGEVFQDLDVSIASDDKGFAVWEDDAHGISMASTDPIVDENAPPGTGTTQVEYPNATITLGGVKGCVPAGGSTKVTLGFKRRQRKGNVWIKPFRVDFSVAGRLVKKVTKAPFRATIKIKASAPKGSFVEVVARAFIKVKKGKVPKKSVKVRIPVCA